jgi:hypothetical protein
MTSDNRIAVTEANAHGFTVNLSANNATHADELAALEIGAATAKANAIAS